MTDERFLPLPEVKSKIGKSKAFIYTHMAKDEFPKPVKVGRSSVWVQSEVESWMRKMINQRDAA